MATVESKFYYTIEMNYISDSKEIKIDTKSIVLISVIYDYDKYNQPLILVTMNIKSSLLNKMKKGIKKDKLYLKIQKYDSKSKSKMMKTYIEEQFSYYFSDTDLDYSSDIEEEAVENNDDNSNSYRKVQFALLKSELINLSKNKLYNGVYNNGNILSVVIDNIGNINKFVIEPFDNKNNIKNLIIPPTSGLVNLLNFLNKRYTFYKTGYRFFMDYKKYYLVSKKGKSININDGTYGSMKIEIKKDTDSNAFTEGMVFDNTNKIYIVPVEVNNTITVLDTTTEKKVNSIYAIDTDGNTLNSDFSIHKFKDTSKITKVYRASDGNLDYVKTIQNDIELNSSIVTVTKSNIDVSLFTINRHYSIEHYEKYSSLTGNYLIMKKQEVFTIMDDESFNCSASITFAKLKS